MQLNHFGGGGEARSPDGRWLVWSHAADADENDSTPVYLSGPGVPQRKLMDYERALDAIWLPGSRRVLLQTQTAHFSTINVFTLGATEAVPGDALQTSMEQQLAHPPGTLKHDCYFAPHCPVRPTRPVLASIEERGVLLGEDLARPCAIMEEWGLPRGRRTGSYVGRRMIFRLELDTGRAVPTARCPGAVIPA